MRVLALGLFPCLMALSGCYYYVSNVPYYSVNVTTNAAPTPTYTGFQTTLSANYVTENVAVYIVAHEWSMVTAAGPYILEDNGFTGNLTVGVAGQYTLRYRTWYYTNYDYCCSATEYRESYVVITALVPPSG
jgi:hypothetical protein